MSRLERHAERHLVARIGWLRAAVLGANDGLVSTASLIVGVAAAQTGKTGILVAGVAGLVAGAMSMAAGEYVSVSSQSDTETSRGSPHSDSSRSSTSPPDHATLPVRTSIPSGKSSRVSAVSTVSLTIG